MGAAGRAEALRQEARGLVGAAWVATSTGGGFAQEAGAAVAELVPVLFQGRLFPAQCYCPGP